MAVVMQSDNSGSFKCCTKTHKTHIQIQNFNEEYCLDFFSSSIRNGLK